MKEIEWKEEYNIGVDAVDSAHKQLFSIVRRIASLLGDKIDDKTRFACIEGIKFFKSYTVKHFAEEEEYMVSIGYDAYERHRAIHERLKTETLPVLEKELEESNYSLEAVERFLGICIGWLTVHIMLEDKAITGRAAGGEISVHSAEDVAAFGTSFQQLIKAVFGIDASVESEHYSGWDFGNAVYYESDYNGNDGSGMNIVMVIEDRFAATAVGRMIGISMAKGSKVVLSAMREMVNVFMLRIERELGLSHIYQPDNAGWLREGGSSQIYNTREPQYSLLFDTKWGHLAVAFYMDVNAS